MDKLNTLTSTMFFYILPPIIALIAVLFIYIKSTNGFDDGINYEYSEASRTVYKYIHNEVITENKNSNFKYYQFSNISIPTKNGTTLIDNLLIAPQGIFVFNSLHYQQNVLMTEFGFLLLHNHNCSEKLDVETTFDLEVSEYLNNHFSSIKLVNINYFTVFTSKLITNCSIHNVISTSQISQIINSKDAILSETDIRQIIGQLVVLNSTTGKKQSALAA